VVRVGLARMRASMLSIISLYDMQTATNGLPLVCAFSRQRNKVFCNQTTERCRFPVQQVAGPRETAA
jgi:hypothetical protein